MRTIKKHGKAILNKELKKSYNFFIKEANTNKKSKGYGLIKDKTQLANSIASIASVGYGLAALIIGVKHKWIKYEKAYARANRTLETFIKNVEGKNGFYYHFINMELRNINNRHSNIYMWSNNSRRILWKRSKK